MINSEKNTYWTKYILYVTSCIWVLYLVIFFHELGHAVAIISLGGTVEEFVVLWDFSGYVRWIFENVPQSEAPRIVTLVDVSGGIGAALFLMVLSHKSKWFMIPAGFCLLDGFAEALSMGDTRYNATNSMGVCVIIICAMLFWQFEVREQNKRRMKIGPRPDRQVPEHIYEKAMRALEKCVGKLEEKHDELVDCKKKENELEVTNDEI